MLTLWCVLPKVSGRSSVTWAPRASSTSNRPNQRAGYHVAGWAMQISWGCGFCSVAGSKSTTVLQLLPPKVQQRPTPKARLFCRCCLQKRSVCVCWSRPHQPSHLPESVQRPNESERGGRWLPLFINNRDYSNQTWYFFRLFFVALRCGSHHPDACDIHAKQASISFFPREGIEEQSIFLELESEVCSNSTARHQSKAKQHFLFNKKTKKKTRRYMWEILSPTRLNRTEIKLTMYVCCFVLLNRYWEIVTGLEFPWRRSNGHVPTIHDRRRKISPCLPLYKLGWQKSGLLSTSLAIIYWFHPAPLYLRTNPSN